MAPAKTETQHAPSKETKQGLQTPGSQLLHRSLTHPPEMVESASGLEIRLADGRTILDACGGAAVSVLGHNNQQVLEAMLAQAQKVAYVHTQAYTTSAAEELAALLVENGRPHGLEKAFFVGSGSEAIESAAKLARQYFYERGETQRLHFVSRRQAYHGNSMAAMSLSSNVVRKLPYQGFGYPNVSHVTPAYEYRYKLDGEDEDKFTKRLLGELDDEFERLGPGNVIAFVAEPVIGATAGCVPPPRGYLAGVRSLCDKYGILLILDEVMCGAGRCGTFFAFEQEGDVRPDIVTLAKGLGGGYAPIAGILIHEKVVDVLRKGSGSFVNGHTYQAHPIVCATALAVQKIIRQDRLVERCAEIGPVLEAMLREELQDCKSVGDIRGRGFFWGVEFVRDRVTKKTFDPAIGFGVQVQQEAFRRGVAVYPGSGTVDGMKGDHVLLAPPYTAKLDELTLICKVLKESIKSQEEIHLHN
ncbi:unnamed protein product [Clonostachys rosea f. rosea IK726]|uniref:Uncharacterized protein n=1 Tax=Clonostachys rosea f. rosea IK726 TaxID=1349383 RepID=A0ACA9TT72_BIOOC|nr:unnamed protein product [Clonostachys rosea f. rosea IK726]